MFLQVSANYNVIFVGRMLNMMLDDSSGIVGGNAVSLLNALARNPSANKAALDFLNNQWNTLAQR